jgi:CARDB
MKNSIQMKNSIPSVRTSVSRSFWRFFASTGFCFACGAGLLHATPGPTYSFDTGTGADQISIGGGPADANVAASSTHICVTARGAFACYTKSGALVNPGPRLSARPYEAQDFFTKSGISATSVPPGTTFAKDGRVVFDQYRKRFFMAFQSREEHPRLLIAVSKSEDPRDGWWIYADNVETADANGQDYMRLGINGKHFLVSNMMKKCQGTYPNPPKPSDPWVCNWVSTRHLMYTADDLAAGKPYSRSEPQPNLPNDAVPCVHDSYTTDAFWVRRDDNTHASIWAVRDEKVTHQQVNIQTSTNAVDGLELGGGKVDYGTIINRVPQNCQYRNGRIVWVSNDGHTWSGQSSPNNAVRLVRLNVSKFFDPVPSVTVEIDRIFGRASAGDRSGAIFDYGWPAVSINANGDIVVGSVRSNATIYPELRASVWSAGQPDLSPSVSLAKSSSPLTAFHMAGASADPSTSGVYVAQQYGSSSPPWRIHVAKMLGEILPDLIAMQVKPPATIAHGDSGTTTVIIMNQGDGPTPSSFGTLYLSTDNKISLGGPDITEDPSLATFPVPALAPNEVKEVTVPFTIAARQPAGKYFVGVALNPGNSIAEYSFTNNVNPFLTGDHGNAPITVN